MHISTMILGTLALLSAASVLVRKPWTSVIARRNNPPELWQTPLFLETNLVLSGACALLFGLAALLAQTAPLWANLGFGLLLALLGHFSTKAGAWYSERRMASMGIELDGHADVVQALRAQLVAANPWNWAPPRFGESQSGETDVLVIGSGIGGLTAAALLAKNGRRVTVIEQHTIPGGYSHSWKRMIHGPFGRARAQFDAGVHDVSGTHPGGTLDNILRRLGAHDRIEWLPIQQEYVTPALRLQIPEDWETLVSALGERFPADADGVRHLFVEMRAVYDGLFSLAQWPLGVPRPPQTVEAMLDFAAKHPKALQWREVSFTTMLDHFLSDPDLKQFLSVLTAYLTDRPEALTVGQMAPIFGFYFNGGRYPAGGAQRIPDALVEVIREGGGEILFKRGVRRILVENGCAVGVELEGGDRLRAAAVISNADLRQTLTTLLDPEHLPADYLKRFGRLEASASGVAVQLVVDFVPDIAPLTIVSGKNRLDFAIATPSAVDPSLAPDGCATLEIFRFERQADAAAWDRSSDDYAERKRDVCDDLIAQAETLLPGLSEHILFREDSSPRTFERFSRADGGGFYGPAAGALLPPAKSPIRGLVFAGAGVFPGAGVEAVVISGALAAHSLDPDVAA